MTTYKFKSTTSNISKVMYYLWKSSSENQNIINMHFKYFPVLYHLPPHLRWNFFFPFCKNKERINRYKQLYNICISHVTIAHLKMATPNKKCNRNIKDKAY